MTALPSATVQGAADLLARGFLPIDPVGRVSPPIGVQTSAAQFVSDWTWQAMCLLQLQAQPPR